MPEQSTFPQTVERFAKLHLRDYRAGLDLELRQDNLRKFRKNEILLVSCLRNERFRMEFFRNYYKKLGVSHFLFVDNASDDGFADWAAQYDDVSVWWTDASYKAAKFGMLWCNDLLRRHASGRWAVVVDPDEFLVFPRSETRGLADLVEFLDEERRRCMHAVLLDAYSDRSLGETVLGDGDDPFALCPYFDRDGYIQQPGWGDATLIRGGPRMRVHFANAIQSAPALNKIPLVKWRPHFHFRSSTHDANPHFLNRANPAAKPAVTAALFHFKLIASLRDKSAEEIRRQQHYDGSREYRRYLEVEDERFYDPGISVRYEGSQQLVDLGLMAPGRWF
ncbi:MAG: glycosyltransferase family 2 protein [Pseudomonadota bacterium]